jgi:hypothetical protein
MTSRPTSPATDSVWTPDETDPQYFRTWQRVSVHLQKRLRPWISERYFSDAARAENRDAGYSMVLYAACRPCYGRRPADFTFDVADPATLPAAWRAIGRALQLELARAVRQIRAAAPPALVRRYAPVWHQDILIAVQKKPRKLIALFAVESALIDALIDWGTIRNGTAEKRFAKAVASAARVYTVVDPLELRRKALDEVERALRAAAQAPDSAGDLMDGGILEDRHLGPARGPDSRIG